MAEENEVSTDQVETVDQSSSVPDGQQSPAVDQAAWYGDGIEDEKHLALAGRYTSAADAISALAETQRTLSQRPRVLGPDASSEDLTAYRTEQGLPTSTDGYELIRPDGMDEAHFKDDAFQNTLTPYREIMLKHNLPTEVLQEIFDARMQQESDTLARSNARDEENSLAGETTMRKEYGEDYDRQMSNAAAFLKVLGADELLEKELAGGKLLGSDPAFMRIAAMAGSRLGIGTAQLGLAGTEAGKDLQQEYNEVSEALHLAHGQGNTTEMKRLDTLRGKLGEQLHGTGAVGAGAPA